MQSFALQSFTLEQCEGERSKSTHVSPENFEPFARRSEVAQNFEVRRALIQSGQLDASGIQNNIC